jgi:hypothetical protein
MIVAACGWTGDCPAHGKEKTRRKGRQATAQSAEFDRASSSAAATPRPPNKKRRRSDDTLALRYLPDNCRMFGRVEMAPVLQSAMIRRLMRQGEGLWQEYHRRFNPLGLDVKQIERIYFGATSLSDDAEYVAVLFCSQRVAQEGQQGNAEWTLDAIGSRKLWVKSGEQAWALCAVDDKVVLAGHPGAIRQVLARDKSTELPEAIRSAYQKIDKSSGVAVSFLSNLEGDLNWPLPIAAELAPRIIAVNMEFDFASNMSVRLRAMCDSEEAAQELQNVGYGLRTLMQAQSQDTHELPVQNLVGSVKLEVQGSELMASMTVPSALVQVAAVNSAPAVSPPLAPPIYRAPSSYSRPVQTLPAPSAAIGAPSFNPYGRVPPPQARWQTPAPAVSPLEVAAVIQLVNGGVHEEVIIRHIKKHRLASALTVADLILLTKEGVSTQVIIALQEIPLAAPPMPAPASSAPHGHAPLARIPAAAYPTTAAPPPPPPTRSPGTRGAPPAQPVIQWAY